MSTKNPVNVCDIYRRSICVQRNSTAEQPFDGPDGKLGSAEKYKTCSLADCLEQTHAHAAEQDT